MEAKQSEARKKKVNVKRTNRMKGKKEEQKRIENTTGIVNDDTVHWYHCAYVRFPDANTGTVPSIDFQLHSVVFRLVCLNSHLNQMYTQIFSSVRTAFAWI